MSVAFTRNEVGKLKMQPTDKAIRKLWNDLEEYLIDSPIGFIDAVEVSAELFSLDLSVENTAEFKVKGKKTPLEGKVTKIDSATNTVTLKTNIGFIVVPFYSLLTSAEYTLRVNCSCEMQFTLTEQEVESADGSGGDEGDVEPTDKVLFSMREEFKEYLSSNSNGWEVDEEVYITAECDDLLNVLNDDRTKVPFASLPSHLRHSVANLSAGRTATF